MRVVAYTWRAAEATSTPAVQAVSTCRLFSLNRHNKPKAHSSDAQLDLAPPVLFLVAVEVTMRGSSHLHACNESANLHHTTALGCLRTCTWCWPAPLDQHGPIGGTPLAHAHAQAGGHGFTLAGCEVYLSFGTVAPLRCQHLAAHDGRRLYDLTRAFATPGPMTPQRRELLTQFCDDLQRKTVVDWDALIPRTPRVVVLRQDVRPSLNMRLALSRAKHLGAVCVARGG